jgi:4-azaleucine resistance transporter AzlC
MDRAILRDILLVCLADGLVGVSFGAIAVSEGFPLWIPVLLSLIVFGGASQFVFVAVLAAGGNPLAGMLAGLLINTRHLPFGFAIGDVLAGGTLRRIVGTHLMIDESVAFAMARREPERRRAAYWGCGVGLFVCWNVGVLIGGLGGDLITDTDALGLDAAFPAVLLALVLPSLKDRRTALAVAVGVTIALVSTPLLPPGPPILLAMIGALILLREPRRSEVSSR